jgi:hypothetical protein
MSTVMAAYFLDSPVETVRLGELNPEIWAMTFAFDVDASIANPSTGTTGCQNTVTSAASLSNTNKQTNNASRELSI